MGKRKGKRKRNDSHGAKPSIPAQQLKRSVEQPSAWTRLVTFLITPSWQGFGTWLGVALAVVGVVLAVVLPIVGHYEDQRKQREAAEHSVSRIDYAWFIKPAPAPSEQFEKTGRWEVSVMVDNGGPLTAETVVLHLVTPPPSVFSHSPPTVMSSPAAAKVEIIERTPGIYQIVYSHLTPGDAAFVRLFYQVPEEMKPSFMQAWRQGGLFDKEFAKRFINQFFFTGEHLKVSNSGALDFEPSL